MMPPFTMVAPTSSQDGYGVAAESLILAATREHDADIAFIEHDWRDAKWTDPALLRMRVEPWQAADRDILVVMFIPFALAKFRSRITISMTMWESDRLPDRWAFCGRLADGLIVPSEHCREVFGARWDCPIRVAPYGTDTNFYTFKDRDAGRIPFQFLMTGLLHYRKGAEFALRAFREEFDAGEPVELILKTRRDFLDVGCETATLEDPRVEVLNLDLSRQEMRSLYGAADCFLAPSRGEGSGLTPRDAMATGLPVIATDWSGLREIASDDAGWRIPVDALEEAPGDCTSYGSGVTGGGPIGNFARPSIPALRAAMRDAYENRGATRAKGRVAADWMRRDFSWGTCAGQWLDALESLPIWADA